MLPKRLVQLASAALAGVTAGAPAGAVAQAPRFELREVSRIGVPAHADLTRLIEAHLSRTGDLFITTGGTSAVCVVRADGGTRTVGESAELKQPSSFGWRRDTLWVVDLSRRAVVWFDESGDSVVRRISTARLLPSRQGEETPWALLADGTVAVTGPLGSAAGRQAPQLFEIRSVELATGATRRVSRLDLTHSTLTARNPAGDGQVTLPQPWSDGELLAISPLGDRLVVVTRRAAASRQGAAYVVRSIAPSGDVLFVTRVHYRPRRLSTAAAARRVKEIARGSADAFDDESTATRVLWRALFRPHYYPPATSLVAARDGTTWVEREDLLPQRFDVFDQSGRLVKIVMSEVSIRVLEADGNRVWALTRDENANGRISLLALQSR